MTTRTPGVGTESASMKQTQKPMDVAKVTDVFCCEVYRSAAMMQLLRCRIDDLPNGVRLNRRPGRRFVTVRLARVEERAQGTIAGRKLSC